MVTRGHGVDRLMSDERVVGEDGFLGWMADYSDNPHIEGNVYLVSPVPVAGFAVPVMRADAKLKEERDYYMHTLARIAALPHWLAATAQEALNKGIEIRNE